MTRLKVSTACQFDLKRFFNKFLLSNISTLAQNKSVHKNKIVNILPVTIFNNRSIIKNY